MGRISALMDFIKYDEFHNRRRNWRMQNAASTTRCSRRASIIERPRAICERNRKAWNWRGRTIRVVSHRCANGLALVTDMTDAASVKLNAELALVDAEINLYYCYYAIRFAAGNL